MSNKRIEKKRANKLVKGINKVTLGKDDILIVKIDPTYPREVYQYVKDGLNKLGVTRIFISPFNMSVLEYHKEEITEILQNSIDKA
jgi:Na+-transporting NADH:ubiquinone oxidoreductase subunit NqrA